MSTPMLMKTINNRPGFHQRMTREEINDCPIRKYEGPVHVIRSKSDMADAVHELEKETILGFDTETRPAFRKGQSFPPSILQLASEDSVFIFQLRRLRFPEPLRKILADPAIIKSGVSLDYDVQELKKLTNFQPAGFIDLGKLAKKIGIKNHGLRGLAAVMLGFRISKGAQVSNWSQDSLTRSQIRYAATDAWVGRILYQAFQPLLNPKQN